MKKSRGGSDEEEEEEEDEFSDGDFATEAGFEAAETSELLKRDMDLFKDCFGKLALTTREFSDIDTIDLELHLNVEFLGASVCQFLFLVSWKYFVKRLSDPPVLF